MKNFAFPMVMILSIVLWSCGGGSSEKTAEKMLKKMGVDESEFKETKEKVEEMAENAQKIAAKEAGETEEDKKTFSDKNVELMGLNLTQRKIPDTTWQKAAVLAEKYRALPDEQLRELTPGKIEEMILDAGFADLNSAKGGLAEISDSRDVVLTVAMDIGMLKSTRVISGDEVYEKEMKELGTTINERGYSADDLRAMDENIKISTAVTEILFRLEQ